MKSEIFEGKVMEDIITAATNHFHHDKQQLIIKVLEEKKGIFGLGARVKAEVTLNLNPIEEGKKYILQILKDLNLTGDVEIVENRKTVTFNINSDHNSIIIGREGKTLQAIQTLTSSVVNQYSNEHLNVLVDIGSYKANQTKKLEFIAKKVAKETINTKVDAKLDPMNAFERRIIHKTLANWRNIETVSAGSDPNRYVMIKYSRKK